MNTLPSIALSGLSAATLRLDSAAHNIANAQTPDFRRQRVAQQAQADGGVTATPFQATQVGGNLIEDVVDQMAALYAFKANVLVLKTGDSMLGALLDLKA